MDSNSLIAKYYVDCPELLNILLTHSTAVRDRALRICDNHPELGADREFIAEAAMLHDIGIIFCNAPKIYCFGTHHYIEHGYLGAELLRKEGLPRHANVAERHTGTGLTLDEVRQNNWPIPLQDYSPRTIEEQIICYADKFYSKSRPDRELTVPQAAQSLEKFGHEGVVKFLDWAARFE